MGGNCLDVVVIIKLLLLLCRAGRHKVWFYCSAIHIVLTCYPLPSVTRSYGSLYLLTSSPIIHPSVHRPSTFSGQHDKSSNHSLATPDAAQLLNCSVLFFFFFGSLEDWGDTNPDPGAVRS